MAHLSKAEKLLVAAGRLAEEGKTEFSAEDLAVQAHRLFPHDFSLKGYKEYPDSNAVFTQVMGRKAAVIVRGWLEKIGTKQYRLTPKGIDNLNQLDPEEGGKVVVRLDRKREEKLGHLLTSQAFELYKAKRQNEITFHQFCRFAEISARDKWQKILGKLESLEHAVGEAKQMGEAGEGARIWVRNRSVEYSPEDLRTLEPLLRFLKERFNIEMQQWESNVLG